MIEREIPEVDIGELTRAEMLTKLSESHSYDFAELTRPGLRVGDLLRSAHDGNEPLRPTRGRKLRSPREFDLPSEPGLL
jgi:hypothetical protein